MKKHISRKRKSDTKLEGQPPHKRRKMGIEDKFSLEVVRKQKQMLGMQVKEKNRELKRLNERNDALVTENRNLGEVVTLFHEHHKKIDSDLQTLFPSIESKRAQLVVPPPPHVPQSTGVVKKDEGENVDIIDVFLSSYNPNKSLMKIPKKEVIKTEIPSTSSHHNRVEINEAVEKQVTSSRRVIRTFYNALDKKRQEQEDFFRQYFQEQKPDVVLQELRQLQQKSEQDLKQLRKKHQEVQLKYRKVKDEYTSKTVKLRQLKKEMRIVTSQFGEHDRKMRKATKDVEELSSKVEELEKQNSQLVVKLKQQTLPVSTPTSTAPSPATEKPESPTFPTTTTTPNVMMMMSSSQGQTIIPPSNIPQEQQQRRANTLMEQENTKLRQLVNDLRLEVDEVKILLSKRTEQLEQKTEKVKSLQNCFIDSGGLKPDQMKGEEERIRSSSLYAAKSKLAQEYMEKNDKLYSELRNRENEIERLRGELTLGQSRLEGIFDNRAREYGEQFSKRDARIISLEQEVTRLRLKLSSMKYQEQLSLEVKQLQQKLESKEKKLVKLQEEIELRGVDKKELVQRLHFSQKSYKIQKKKLEDVYKQNEGLKNVIKRFQDHKQRVLDQQQQQKQDMNNDVSSSENNQIIVDLMTKNEQLAKRNQELESTIQKLGSDGGKERIGRLEEELSYEKEMTEQFEKEMEELSRHCQNLEKYKDKLNAQIHQFQVEKRKFILENVKATNHNEILGKEISLLKKEREQFQQLIELKDKEKASFRNVVTAKEKAIVAARKETELEKTAQDKIRKDMEGINLKLGEARQAQLHAENEVRNQKKIAKGAVSESQENLRKANHYEEECEKLSKRLERIENSEENAELVQRIEYWKKFALCPICKVRVKSKVITKCSHAFCTECLEKSVGARNRKCPQCGDPFSPKTHITKLFL